MLEFLNQELVILILLVVVVMTIINIGINFIVNNKLSNISVSVPQPVVNVRIQKAGLSDDYQVFVEKKQLKNNIENFENNNYTVTNTNTNTNNNVEQRIEQKQDTKMNQNVQITRGLPITVDNIEFPHEDQLVDYNGNKIIDMDGFDQDIKIQKESNENNENKGIKQTPINQIEKNQKLLREYNDKYDRLTHNVTRQVMTDIEDGEDIGEFYSKHLEYARTYLEDPITRGANIYDFDGYAKITDIGNISMTNGEKEKPRPIGYVFPDSSSLLE